MLWGGSSGARPRAVREASETPRAFAEALRFSAVAAAAMADVVAAARGVVVVGGVVLGASAVEASSVVVAAAPPKRKRLRSWAKALGVAAVAAVAALSVATPEALVAVTRAAKNTAATHAFAALFLLKSMM